MPSWKFVRTRRVVPKLVGSSLQVHLCGDVPLRPMPYVEMIVVIHERTHGAISYREFAQVGRD